MSPNNSSAETVSLPNTAVSRIRKRDGRLVPFDATKILPQSSRQAGQLASSAGRLATLSCCGYSFWHNLVQHGHSDRGRGPGLGGRGFACVAI